MLCSSSDVAWLRQRLLIVVMSPEDGTQAAADQPSSRMTSAARRCVAFSISPNRSSNFDMMPSGGPPSMISRRSTGIPTDIRRPAILTFRLWAAELGKSRQV